MNTGKIFTDGSRLIIESLVQSGAEVYVGYPITPANWLYAYAQKRFPNFLAAPDEITALQWAAGFAAAGKLPVTATSFPGFALMLETLNMAYMMELPLVIVLAQRLGPATGSATTGAQGDLLLLRGCISGGYSIPVLCPSDFRDCWTLASESVRLALRLRTPVVLLTSKEMIMTGRSFNPAELEKLRPVPRTYFQGNGQYFPYKAEKNEAPPFLPVGNEHHPVRLNASTHDSSGLIRKATPEAITNTKRLQKKIISHLDEFGFFEYYSGSSAEVLIVSYGISAGAAWSAVKNLRNQGIQISLLILKTLLPLPSGIPEIINQYARILFVEENYSGQLQEIILGRQADSRIRRINKIGQMITPAEIETEVKQWQVS